MNSWKTTSAGITMIVAGIVGGYFAYKNGQFTEPAIMAAVTSVLGGLGLIFAKDKNVTGGTVLNTNNDASIVKEAGKKDQP